MRRIQLAADREHAQHDNRARQRHDKPEDDAARDRVSRDQENGERRKGRDADLQGASKRDRLPDEAQTRERKLEPDREQEQNHADFGDLLNVLRVANQPEAMRSSNGAGDKEADGRGKAEAVQADCSGHGQAADNRQLAEQVQFRHACSWPGGTPCLPRFSLWAARAESRGARGER